MKIKEVCAKTGLTDKAIRHYIRNGLVFPVYNENYTGRKSYSFSECDVEHLNQTIPFPLNFYITVQKRKRKSSVHSSSLFF